MKIPKYCYVPPPAIKGEGDILFLMQILSVSALALASISIVVCQDYSLVSK